MLRIVFVFVVFTTGCAFSRHAKKEHSQSHSVLEGTWVVAGDCQMFPGQTFPSHDCTSYFQFGKDLADLRIFTFDNNSLQKVNTAGIDNFYFWDSLGAPSYHPTLFGYSGIYMRCPYEGYFAYWQISYVNDTIVKVRDIYNTGDSSYSICELQLHKINGISEAQPSTIAPVYGSWLAVSRTGSSQMDSAILLPPDWKISMEIDSATIRTNWIFPSDSVRITMPYTVEKFEGRTVLHCYVGYYYYTTLHVADEDNIWLEIITGDCGYDELLHFTRVKE